MENIKKTDFLSYLKDNTVFLDGGMGTLLQKRGLRPGELPERWNISHPDVIIDIHKSYYDSGSNVVCTNTFGANSLKYDDKELNDVILGGIKNARKAAEISTGNQQKFVALDIGPLGKLLKPFGDLDFEEAVEIFKNTVKIGLKGNPDLILIETMNDSYETKAALLAVKESCDLPVFVSNAYSENSKLMTGASPKTMVAICESLGADAIGANCSLGPKELERVVDELLEYASIPVLFKPNAGLPKSVDGETVFDVSAEDFALEVKKQIEKGVRVAGGCCGTTPEYIKSLTQSLENSDLSNGDGSIKASVKIEPKNHTIVTSYANAVELSDIPVLIGERINPTGKKRFKQALVENDIEYILQEAVNQAEKGADVLDVNVGLPEIDEEKMLSKCVTSLQSVVDLPLCIDTSDTKAMESALRIYNGKPLINSVNGKKENMEAVFPIAKKYGGVIMALTLDEKGIPNTAQGRLEIAKRILSVAESYGINKKDIIFDTLTMTVSADKDAAKTTLDALKLIREETGCLTSLGISNVSFGLPQRDFLTSSFFLLALQNGLSAAIMNPYSDKMMSAYYSYKVLKAYDSNCAEYIDFCNEYEENLQKAEVVVRKESTNSNDNAKGDEKAESENALKYSIIKGLKDNAGTLTKTFLQSRNPLDIVNEDIIPALDEVGKAFEKNKIYLPQLLMSAESAKEAFEEIKKVLPENSSTKCKVVIATVKGDIHDIGKNIVKLLMQNYGYDVIDLGKDVEPKLVLKTVLEHNAPFAALSALMTTTVPAMEETIKLIHEKAPFCKVLVGGAVLTQEYADKIGADKYGKDALDSVRYLDSEMQN